MVDDAVAVGMRRMGASEEQVQQALARRGAARGDADDGAFVVEEDAWEAWCFFMDVQRHWVREGLAGVRSRLDFTAIQSIVQMRGMGRRRMARLADDLLLIERAVLEEDEQIEARRPRRRGM